MAGCETNNKRILLLSECQQEHDCHFIRKQNMHSGKRENCKYRTYGLFWQIMHQNFLREYIYILKAQVFIFGFLFAAWDYLFVFANNSRGAIKHIF